MKSCEDISPNIEYVEFKSRSKTWKTSVSLVGCVGFTVKDDSHCRKVKHMPTL